MSSVPQNVIKHKVELLNLVAELGNLSHACRVMGFSRDTFYRYQSAVAECGGDALINASRKKPNLSSTLSITGNKIRCRKDFLPASYAPLKPAPSNSN